MRLLARRCLCRARAVEALFEDWKTNPSHASLANDLDQLSCESGAAVEIVSQAWQTLRELLLKDPNCDEIEPAGQTLKLVFTKLLSVLDAIRNAMDEAMSRRQQVIGSEKLQSVMESLRAIRTKVEAAFPQFDTSSDEEDIAAFKRGEFLTIEEMIREVQSSGVGAD